MRTLVLTIYLLESIYLYFPPSSQLVYLFLSCRPFVAITLSTGLVGVEVTSVSWLRQTVDNVVIATEGLQDRNKYTSWDDGGK